MISNDCTARLVDVGIKGVLAVLYSIDTGTLNSKIDGTRYMAPELLLLDNVGGLTKECDIHSFAMTVYEVCSFCIVYDHR